MNYLALMMHRSQSEEQVVDFVKNVGEGKCDRLLEVTLLKRPSASSASFGYAIGTSQPCVKLSKKRSTDECA